MMGTTTDHLADVATNANGMTAPAAMASPNSKSYLRV